MLQFFIIITLPKLVHLVLVRLGQPLVVSEIISGIILGPTIMGQIPNFTKNIFPAASLSGLQTIAQLSLVLFLLLVGLNLDPKKILKNSKHCVTYSFVGIIAPTIMAIPLSFLVNGSAFTNAKQYIVVLIIGVIFSISALSLLARILGEIGFLKSELGTVTMCTTAFDTLFCWIYLGIIIALSKSESSVLIKYSGIWVVLATIAHAVVLWFVIRPLLRLITKRVNRKGQMEPITFFLIVLIALGVAYFTEQIGVSGLIGAFEVGLLVPRKGPTPLFVRERLNDTVVIILLPIYMTFSGLRTDLTLLNSAHYWGIALLFVVAGFVSKGLSLMLLARYFKMDLYDGLGFGVLLSCKGLVSLAMLNTVLDAGLITKEFFAVFIVYSLAATLITTPVLKATLLVKRKRQMKKVKMHETYNILVLPQTPYYVLPTMDFAHGLSKRTGSISKLVPRITAARTIELDEHDSAMNQKKYVKQDPILGPCLQLSNYLSMHSKTRFFTTNNPAREILEKSEETLKDAIILGYDKTLASQGIIKNLLKESSAHLCVYFAHKKFEHKAVGRILVPYSGSLHDKLAIKIARRFVTAHPQEVIIMLIDQDPTPLEFLQQDNPKAFPNVYIVSKTGARMNAIKEELSNNTNISLLITGDISVGESIEGRIELLNEFTRVHCPVLFCSSKKSRKQAKASM